MGVAVKHFCTFRECTPDTLVAPRVVALMKEWLKESPDFGSDDLAEWAADVEAAVAEGSFCYAVNRFVCRCVK